MPDFEAPERDAIEREQPADAAGAATDAAAAEVDLEAPEADAVEQHTPVRTPEETATLSDRPIEADDADAAEQAHVVEFDEDDYR